MTDFIKTKIEIPIGDIDGINDLFETTLDYIADSLQVWYDGVLIKKDFDDGFIELGNKQFRLKQIPPENTKLSVWYQIPE